MDENERALKDQQLQDQIEIYKQQINSMRLQEEKKKEDVHQTLNTIGNTQRHIQKPWRQLFWLYDQVRARYPPMGANRGRVKPALNFHTKVLKEHRKLDDDQFPPDFIVLSEAAVEINPASAAGFELNREHLASLDNRKKEKDTPPGPAIERIHHDMRLENRSKKSGTTALVAAVLGIGNLIGLTALAIWLWRKDRKQRKAFEGKSRTLSKDIWKANLRWVEEDQIRRSLIRRRHPREFSQKDV